MTPRTFWMILIKILGVYLILESLTLIIPFITETLFLTRQQDSSPSYLDVLLGFLITGGLYFLAIRYFIFRTEVIVDKLHLDKGFTEEKFEINIHRSTVLKISVIVIGAIIIADSLPLLCRQVFFFFQANRAYLTLKDNPASVWIVFYFVKFSIGFALISASRPIVNFIELKRKKPAQNEEI
jgi:hypothetical protein